MFTSQQRTAKARQAFAAKFTTPEEKSAYFRDLAKRKRGSVTLSPTDAQALRTVEVDIDSMTPAQRTAWRKLWRELLDNPAKNEAA